MQRGSSSSIMLSARLCRELATSRGTLLSSRGIFLSSRGLLTYSNMRMVRLPRSEVKAARILLQRFVFNTKNLV